MAKVLDHKVDSYNGVEITDAAVKAGEARGPAVDVEEFESALWHSLSVWKKEKRKGIWLQIHIEKAELVPAAVRAGFVFHHADPDSVTLTAWVNAELKNKMPPGPSHFVGVAGFVLNSKEEVLCIREKSGPSARLPDFWKLPGGLVDPQEDLRLAAEREVKEETGIDAVFHRLATVQEIHHGNSNALARTGTTDMYCITILKVADENQEIVPQADEVAECKWVPLDELLNLRYYSKEGTVFYKMFRAAADVALGQSPGLEAESLEFGFTPAVHTLYSAAKM
mmetsp:Transcript_22298/g.39529  ORF Transcript_22298/g.39529 Transcript_22298/m.39529 type:complete len:281 (-) Transcript_22298:111-953(-)|eukprot:CAMPEP_0184526666 /NCGR_PEP_ID=MMETSP0198_2-20121128/10777_1 /TAXON_ID=1112570 /ORGANISM="Thraustochytrium sp., Strain LLF1b" /LENGTH=280 /DNA_ID=CAMNT_0026918255 /DNA_START=352 /DNA_END=1194 /DNA_ORIENTATION=-